MKDMQENPERRIPVRFPEMTVDRPDRGAMALAGKVAVAVNTLTIQPLLQDGWRDMQVLADGELTGILDGDEGKEELDKVREKMNRAGPVRTLTETFRQMREADTCKALIFSGAAGEKTQIVLSFRGTTRRLFDWISNLRMQQEAGVHQGFLELTEQVLIREKDIHFPQAAARMGKKDLTLPEIIEACREKDSGYRIILVGHSQGSAVAQLYMESLLHRQVRRENITGICFASPSVFISPGTAGPYPMVHIINSDDTVPHMGARCHLGRLLLCPADRELRKTCYAWGQTEEEVEARMLVRSITGRMVNTGSDILVSMAYLRILEEEPMGVLSLGLQSMGYPALHLPEQMSGRLDASARRLLDRALQYAADAYEGLFGREIREADLVEIMLDIKRITEKTGMAAYARAFGELCMEPHRIHRETGEKEAAYSYIARYRTGRLIWTDDERFLKDRNTETGLNLIGDI